jgi:DnaJ-class molecular chaperone
MKQQRIFDDLVTCPSCDGMGTKSYFNILPNVIKIKCSLCKGKKEISIHYAKQWYKRNKK